MIGPFLRQAAGNVQPTTAVLRSTVRMKTDFQFAGYRGYPDPSRGDFEIIG